MCRRHQGQSCFQDRPRTGRKPRDLAFKISQNQHPQTVSIGPFTKSNAAGRQTQPHQHHTSSPAPGLSSYSVLVKLPLASAAFAGGEFSGQGQELRLTPLPCVFSNTDLLEPASSHPFPRASSNAMSLRYRQDDQERVATGSSKPAPPSAFPGQDLGQCVATTHRKPHDSIQG